MWAWRVDGDRHLFDWMIFTSNVRKIRGSLSGDNVRLALSQWKTRWYPQSREGDVSTRHVHYPRKVPTIKKFAVQTDGVFLVSSQAGEHVLTQIMNLTQVHGRQPQISLFWPRFGSGFKCIVTNRKSAFLLTLTYYFEATEIPAGISSYFSESLFITAPF